jgi:hypothetical protein
MPEAGAYHVLDVPLLPIVKLYPLWIVFLISPNISFGRDIAFRDNREAAAYGQSAPPWLRGIEGDPYTFWLGAIWEPVCRDSQFAGIAVRQDESDRFI